MIQCNVNIVALLKDLLVTRSNSIDETANPVGVDIKNIFVNNQDITKSTIEFNVLFSTDKENLND